MKHLLIAASLFLALPAHAGVKMDRVTYEHDGTVLEGYIAYDPDVTARRPGVVIVHDWMGVGEYVQERARQIVGLGYVAFVADIYGRGVRPKNVQEASAQAGKYRGDRKLMRGRAEAAVNELSKSTRVDASRIAAIGYCFGGGTVLELARSGAAVSGVVSFHGNLDTPNPADATKIRGKVLVLHGADDPYVPAKQLEAFETEMRTAGVDWELVAYGGAVHAFSQKSAGDDPSKGAAYNASADRRSFDRMVGFLKEVTAP